MTEDIFILDNKDKIIYRLHSKQSTTLGQLTGGIGVRGSLRNRETGISIFNPNVKISEGTYVWVPQRQPLANGKKRFRYRFFVIDELFTLYFANHFSVSCS